MGLFEIFRRDAGSSKRREKPECVGLALGGGAVRGAAHIGVLSAFEEAGIKADVVAGTSVGSIVGAAYAAGLDSVEMLELMRGASWRGFTRPAIGRYSLTDSSPLARFIEKALGTDAIEDLKLPFAAVACDVITGERAVIRTGSVSSATLASSAIPGILPPVEEGGAFYIDGGVVDNVPVSAVRELGADYIIAVDLIPQRKAGERPANVQELLLASFELMQHAVENDAHEADVYVAPAVSGFHLMDFSNVDELYQRGRDAALGVVEGIREDLGIGDSAA